MGANQNKSLMRNLGEFFGHITRGIKADTTDPADPTKPSMQNHTQNRTVRKEVEQEEQLGPDGERIVLRRTTVEEIEIEPIPPKAGDTGA